MCNNLAVTGQMCRMLSLPLLVAFVSAGELNIPGGRPSAAVVVAEHHHRRRRRRQGRHIVHNAALYITIITSHCTRCYFSSIILVMARWRGVSKYLWRFLRFTLQPDTDGWSNISPTFHPLDPRFQDLFQFCFGLFPSFSRSGF